MNYFRVKISSDVFFPNYGMLYIYTLVSWCVGGSKGFAMVELQYTTVAGSYTMVAKGMNAR